MRYDGGHRIVIGVARLVASLHNKLMRGSEGCWGIALDDEAWNSRKSLWSERGASVWIHRCFALPRSSILCGCINFPGKQVNAVYGVDTLPHVRYM
jgi:hypothetical protein